MMNNGNQKNYVRFSVCLLFFRLITDMNKLRFAKAFDNITLMQVLRSNKDAPISSNTSNMYKMCIMSLLHSIKCKEVRAFYSLLKMRPPSTI